MAEEVIRAQRDDPEWHPGLGLGRKESEALIEILAGLEIFDMLSWTELQKLARIVHRRKFIAGEEVLKAWVSRSGLFIIQTGLVNVVRQGGDGTLNLVGTLGPGELLGEFSVVDDSPRSTSIYAEEASELVGFFRPDLMDLIQRDPRLGFKILFRISQRMAIHLRDDLDRLRNVREILRGVGSVGREASSV